MPNYFKNLPLTSYNFQGTENSAQLVVDIFRHVKADLGIEDAVAYTFYDIQENERPDQVSQKFYDTPEYFWTFFIVNDSLWDGIRQWPKGYEELQTFIAEKYTKKIFTWLVNDQLNSSLINTGPNLLHNLKFVVGETLTGNNTGHTAVIDSINFVMNRLECSAATGDFATDTIFTGGTSGSKILTQTGYEVRVQDEALAAHHYEYKFGNAFAGNEKPRILFNTLETSAAADHQYAVDEISNRKYEETLNEERQSIRILKRGIIENFARTYKKLINQ